MTDYTLFCSEKGADPWMHVSLEVAINGIVIHDHSIGDSCRNFAGRDEVEYTVSINFDDAQKILRHLGQEPGKYPLQKLGLYLAEILDGDPGAAMRFRELAEAAGVKPGRHVW